MKKKGILAASALLLIALIIYSQKIYFPIEGTVVDAETGKPIEGAVVLAEWTITKGIGLTATESYMIVETVTDRNGKFKINAYVLNPFVNKPRLTLYKAGYTAWNNRFIFPGYIPRKETRWQSNNTYAIEKFKEEYSHTEHVSFIHTFTLGLTSDSTFEKAYRLEEMKSLQELRERQ